MDLVNKQVTHKSFGKGSVVEHSDSHIVINFITGNKRFVYPDAFGTFLTLTDQKTADVVKEMMEKRENDRKQEEFELEMEKAMQLQEQQAILQREKFMKNLKILPNSQAAFWCEAQEKDTIFTEWRAFTGETKSGVNQGKPNIPVRLNQNSACLLTARDSDMLEKDRCILGVYMVDETFIGKLCEDGFVPAHSEYRLRLTEQESEKMLFWNYYINEKYPNNMTWNTGKYRYFDNVWMAQILKDIAFLKTEPQEKELVQQFLEHFCEMNKIEVKDIPKPTGALMRI